MLKSNSKKAIENIRKYIADHFDPFGHDLEKEPETFPAITLTSWTQNLVTFGTSWKAGT